MILLTLPSGACVCLCVRKGFQPYLIILKSKRPYCEAKQLGPDTPEIEQNMVVAQREWGPIIGPFSSALQPLSSPDTEKQSASPHKWPDTQALCFPRAVSSGTP